MKNKKIRSHCPVNYGLEMFGDRWAMLILRDIIFRGKRTYGEFLKSEEGFSTNILASRLEHFVSVDILRREKDKVDGRKDIYTMTEKGLELIPIILEIMLWSAKFDDKSEARRIKKLMKLIEQDNRNASDVITEKVRQGEAAILDFLD